MQIHFKQGEAGPISDALVRRTQVKLTKLGKFIREGTFEPQAYVDLSRESGAVTSDAQWRASINVDLPGVRLNAQAGGTTPEKAVDLALKDLKRELRRVNEKERSYARREASIWKSFKKSFGS